MFDAEQGDCSAYISQGDAQMQYLYLHNVAIEREGEATSSSKDNLVTTGALEGENHLSMTSVIQKAINVKIQKQITSKNNALTHSDREDDTSRNVLENSNVQGYTVDNKTRKLMKGELLAHNKYKGERTNVRGEETRKDAKGQKILGDVTTGAGSTRHRLARKIEETLRRWSIKKSNNKLNERQAARVERRETGVSKNTDRRSYE